MIFAAHDDHASGRFVARGIVEFRAHGLRSRFATHRSSFRKRHLVCQAVLWQRRGALEILISWVVTQFFVFFTWLIFRVEDTAVLIPSMKTFVGWGGYFDWREMYDFLPEIKFLTFTLATCFVLLHGISGSSGGGKEWLARRHPVIWGAACGTMLCLLRSISDQQKRLIFIYFRF